MTDTVTLANVQFMHAPEWPGEGWEECPRPEGVEYRIWVLWVGDVSLPILVSTAMVEYVEFLPWRMEKIGEENQHTWIYRRVPTEA